MSGAPQAARASSLPLGGVTEAQLYINSATEPSYRFVGDGDFSWAINGIPEGIYEFGGVAWDGPNMGLSEPIDIYVGVEPPVEAGTEGGGTGGDGTGGDVPEARRPRRARPRGRAPWTPTPGVPTRGTRRVRGETQGPPIPRPIRDADADSLEAEVTWAGSSPLGSCPSFVGGTVEGGGHD